MLDKKLIVITGMDGSGKSTQVENLYNYYKSKNIKVKKVKISSRVREAHEYLTKLVENLKIHKDNLDLETRSIIMAFDTYTLIKKEVEQSILDGYLVITDRYIESTEIYLLARNINNKKAMKILKTCYKPDIFFLLDIEVGQAIDRIEFRSDKLQPHENIETLERVKYYFHEYQKKYEFNIVNASNSEKDVFKDILTILSK